MNFAIEDQKQIKSAQAVLLAEIQKSLPLFPEPLTVGFQGGNFVVNDIRTNGEIWFAHQIYTKAKIAKNWNAFGVASDLRLTGSNKIVVEVNTALSDRSRRIAGLFTKDETTGNTLLIHSGKIGGGRKGIGQSAFLGWYKGKKVEYSYSSRPEKTFEGIVVADFGSGRAIEEIEEFVRAVDAFKRGDIQREAEALSYEELLAQAKKAPLAPKPTMSTGTSYSRDIYVATFAKRRAAGKCDLCKERAPFENGGKPYLECHHIKWLAHGGFDSIDNTVALCPNCHRKMHLVKNPDDIRALKKVAKNGAP